MKAAYLFLYNAAQAVGWAYGLFLVVQELVPDGDPKGTWAVSGHVFRACQAASFLEVVHSAVGLVRSPVSAALMQWAGRSNVLFAVVHCVPEVQTSPAVAVLFAMWAISEVIRYPWYALSATGACPDALTWLRYTAFIPLYPIGVISEVWLMYSSLPFLKKRGTHSFGLPNALNFAFDYHLFITGLLCVYPFLWWSLYSYMFQQRARRVGGAKAKTA